MKSVVRLGKQLLPANVYGYVPGFSKVTDRLMRNVEHRQDSQGYVRDVEELVTYWGLEGCILLCMMYTLSIMICLISGGVV